MSSKRANFKSENPILSIAGFQRARRDSPIKVNFLYACVKGA